MSFKKVLYIVTQSEWGGAQTYIYDLTESLLKQGFEIGVAAGTEKNDLFNKLSALESDNLTLFREKHLVRAINPYHDFIEFFRFLKIIWEFNPDVIHLNSSKAGISGTIAGFLYNFLRNPWSLFKKKKTRIIYTAHGFVFNENLSILIYLFYLWLEKICSLMRDKIITVSHYDFKSAIEKNVVSAKKMAVIHNGIDISKRDKILSKVEARGKLKNFIQNGINAAIKDHEFYQGGIAALEFPETQVVGTVANFYENKGLKYLIDAAGEVVGDMPNVVFVLIGRGEMEDKLRKIIKDKKLGDKFFILGAIPDAFKYFHAFDVFCLPSIKEGLSYTLIEALLAGVPIVATDVGGNPEIVKDGGNGYLVQAKNRNALAEKIRVILKNKELRERMGGASYKMADNFSLEEMVRETRGVYEKLQ
ncbi:MAG: glycosyltransferase family 4 protein [bacterium]